MGILESKLIIGAKDETGGAFASIQKHIAAIDKQISTFDKLMAATQRVAAANDRMIRTSINASTRASPRSEARGGEWPRALMSPLVRSASADDMATTQGDGRARRRGVKVAGKIACISENRGHGGAPSSRGRRAVAGWAMGAASAAVLGTTGTIVVGEGAGERRRSRRRS